MPWATSPQARAANIQVTIERNKRLRDAVIEDVEFLLSWGVRGDEIARRVTGTSLAGLIRRLNRAERHDLAVKISPSRFTNTSGVRP